MIPENFIIEKRQRKQFPEGRVFLFVDETGDPGHPSQRDSSKYYQLNIVISHRDSLQFLNKHIAAFRYFRQSGNELKKHTRESKILSEVWKDLVEKRDILFLSFILEKDQYTGPYLKSIGRGQYDFNPKLFRNFVIRKSFEHVFQELIEIDTEKQHLEIVFDRYLDAEKDEENLKAYLRGNYNLPHFEKIIQVDSEYSEAVQVSDYLGRYVKAYCFDGNIEASEYIFEFIRIFILEKPDQIKEKRPDTQ